jgi:lipoprotein-anchoring transpeptidase ErfK/SrfK
VAPRRILFALALVVITLGGGCTFRSKAAQIAVAPVPTPVPTTAPKPVEMRQVAWATVPKVDVFADPAAPAPTTTLKNPTVEKQPLAFLAVGENADWLQVRLPIRPNGSTGWVRRSDVQLGDVQQYRVVVEVAARRLTLYKGDEVVMQELVGVGKPKTPTPIGRFYVDAMVKLNNPNTVWGPYQMSVSGFSPTLDRFMGGVGQIAMHGTNAPGLIPGEISNGCVRMKNAAITKLASLTGIGTPVDIVA